MHAPIVITLITLFSLFAQSEGELCRKHICAYDFVVRESRSMIYAVNYPSGWQDVYDVFLNGSKLSLNSNQFHEKVPEVDHERLQLVTHTLDGVASQMILINDQFPGPNIEVMEGAQIVVNVKNNLLKEILTIHWHGMHQKSTFYSDGVPFVTQCPILPRQLFTYRFFAAPAGTHWYHSHVLNQKKDGLYGAIIIHRKTPVLPSHTLLFSDWFHASATAMEISNPYKTFDSMHGKVNQKTFLCFR